MRKCISLVTRKCDMKPNHNIRYWTSWLLKIRVLLLETRLRNGFRISAASKASDIYAVAGLQGCTYWYGQSWLHERLLP